MYNFDKDYEDDRELLREDPYAEYPDFPKECRMTEYTHYNLPVSFALSFRKSISTVGKLSRP